MSARLIGGPDLRARLASLSDVPAGFGQKWADTAAKQMLDTAPNAREPASRIFTTRVQGLKAAVYGAFWWVFVDRGTKAHDITIRNKQVLSNRTTIFGTKAHHDRTRRVPFISKAAQDAFRGFSAVVIKQWNGYRSRSHKGFL